VVEASALAALYVVLIKTVVHREIAFGRQLFHAFRDCVALVGGVMIILCAAMGFTSWLVDAQVPARFLEWAQGSFTTQFSVLMLMNGVMLVVGMFIDLPAAILLLGPLFVPLAQAYGVDLVQLGVVMVVNLAIGLYTPPVGATLIIGSMISRAPIGHTVRELLPFYAVALLVLAMMSYLPGLTLY
jgi:tripartite ATP-independent transporter DctM subunit